MARPLRLQFPGATYHVFSRGNNRSRIYRTDYDRRKFIDLLGRLREKFAIKIYAYCLMPNHFHLLLETPLPNLSKAVQYLNSTYTAFFNYTHGCSGHLFQGRFKSILVDKECYLLELTRYIHLNPVANGFTRSPGRYRWSSYRSYLRLEGKPIWLETEGVLNSFASNQKKAIKGYREFIEDQMQEKLKDNPLTDVWYQCVLGSSRFIESIKERIRDPGPEVSHAKSLQAYDPDRLIKLIRQSRSTKVSETQLLIYFLRKYTDLTLREINERFGGGHYSRVSQAAKRFEEKLKKNSALKNLVGKLEKDMSNVKV